MGRPCGVAMWRFLRKKRHIADTRGGAARGEGGLRELRRNEGARGEGSGAATL